MRSLEEVLVDDLVRLHLLACEDQVSDLLQMSLGFFTVVMMGRPAPEGLLVELDLLAVGTAIDHRPEMGVADGQSLQPVGGGLVVP